MAKQEVMNFSSFRQRFGTEEACSKYLFSVRWPDGFICPLCGCKKYYHISTRNVYQCKTCKHQTSVISGTVMHKSHLSLQTWFWAIYMIAKDKRGCSALRISDELDISYKTAWYLCHRIRYAMGQRDAEYILAGIVELDDTYFGSPKKGGKRGRGTNKIKVLASLSTNGQNKPEYLKMQVVPDLKGKTISKFATQNIEAGTIINSDAYYSYRKPLAEEWLHQYRVFKPESGMLHWLHTAIGNAKEFVRGTYHGLSKRHMQNYLDEYCYRFNRRFFRDELFGRLLCAVASAPELSFAELSK